MVDKTSWTEPLDSERDALGFVTRCDACRALGNVRGGGQDASMSVAARARRLQCRRNDYDRGRIEGQRGGCARGGALREEKTTQTGCFGRNRTHALTGAGGPRASCECSDDICD